MFRILFRIIYLVLMLMSINAFAANQQIIHFGSNLLVNPDGNVDITETISTYVEPEHLTQDMGRVLPLQIRASTGEKRDLDYDVKQVLLNGQPVSFDIQKEDKQLKIAFDNEAVFTPGIYVYTIYYIVKNLFDEETNELVWNVTGHDWNVPILKTEADIIFPNAVKIKSYKAAVSNVDLKLFPAQAREMTANKLSFASNRALKPGESFIIYANSGPFVVKSMSNDEIIANHYLSIAEKIVISLAALSLVLGISMIYNYQNKSPAVKQKLKFYFSLCLLFSILAIAISLMLSTHKLTMLYSILWIVGWTLICYVLVNRIKQSITVVKQNPTSANIFGIVFFSTFAIPFFIAELIGVYVFSSLVSASLLLSLLLLVIMNLIFYHFWMLETKNVAESSCRQHPADI